MRTVASGTGVAGFPAPSTGLEERMRRSFAFLGMAGLVLALLAGCGSDSSEPAPPPGPSIKDQIAAAAALPANDTATNSSAPFTVMQDAGVAAVTVASPPTVNFTVFSDGAVKTGLTSSNVRFAIAKLVPASNGNPDQWQSYVYRKETATPGVGPGGNPVLESAMQATTDPGSAGQLTYNADGYYTYTFSTDITDPTKTNGVVYEPGLTHRVAIQLSYTNAAGETVLVNPYFDFTIGSDGKSITVTDPHKTRKMTDVSSCNGCHEKLALHGGGRVDTQYCVMCHNPGTVDANSGNVLTLSTMTHKIHSGRLLKSKLDAGQGGEDYTIWGYQNSKHDYAEVGFPQDLRNCTKCHSASNPATPQGDYWKSQVSQQACLTCHANNTGSDWDTSHKVYAGTLVGPNAKAKDLSNQQCKDCHAEGTNLGPDRVHWNQNEENAAKYKMNIESATFDAAARKVTVKYSLTDPTNNNAAYNLVTPDCTSGSTGPSCSSSTKFGNLRFYLAYQNMKGQLTAVTEFSAYNNGGSGANAYAYTGTNLGSNKYSVDIALPADSDIAVASGTARVVSIGQIKEPKLQVKWATDPRPEVVPQELINTVAQHTYKDVVLSGPLQPRRDVVSNDKCNVCHGALGTTSGSNTLAEAFHGGARNTVESCVICHDPNRASSTVMTSGQKEQGLALRESYQFKRMIHGIHGNSKRTTPFTHGNPVVGPFDKGGALLAGGTFVDDYKIRGFSPVIVPAGTAVSVGSTFDDIEALINGNALALGYTGEPVAIENYAAEVAYPQVGLNCNACHVNNSYMSDKGTLGAVVVKDAGVTDPNLWKVISPKAATCTACHDSSAAIGHVTSFGGSSFANLTQGSRPQETCDDCHAPGGFKGVDIVHGQK
jgi:OmcA/MtrC family decaheme c-type cytochrome